MIFERISDHELRIRKARRLAADQSVQGRGPGEDLLVDALQQCLGLAIDLAARNFYLKYGFSALLDNPLHLLPPMKSIPGQLVDA